MNSEKAMQELQKSFSHGGKNSPVINDDIKNYINDMFEKQTAEIKSLLQGVTNNASGNNANDEQQKNIEENNNNTQNN
jgi:hypothetical protein